jgi:cephalosporin-C deacetylase
MRILLTHIIFLFFSISLYAQPAIQAVQVEVTAKGVVWTRKIGEEVSFLISVKEKGEFIREGSVIIEVGSEKMPASYKDTFQLTGGILETRPQTFKEAGFVRCVATTIIKQKIYRGVHTVAYEPEQLKPTVQYPVDFLSFWDNVKKELAALPLDAKLTLLPERSSALTNVYHVSLNSLGSSRLYGILCVPKKIGKYPAILQVPGAGIRPYNPDLELADKGVIVFTIGIHGISVIQDPSLYRDLEAGPLKGYFFFNMHDKNQYYYKRVYAGCIRANDLIASLQEFDGKNLAVSGNSQGGALSIVTASLDPRVKYLAAIHPALCDLTGYTAGRAGGWPHMFSSSNSWHVYKDSFKESLSYYDVLNFAKGLTVPGFYTWGYNDEVCPPTSMHATYNVITAPKSLFIYPETGHWFYPEQKKAMNDWLLTKMGIQ